MTADGGKNPRLRRIRTKGEIHRKEVKMKMQHKGRQDKKKNEGGGRACPANQWDSLLAGAMGDVSR